MRPRMIACAFLAAAAGPAMAQTAPALPNWDPRAHCEHQNRVLATESAFLLRACLNQEDRAETLLRGAWDALPGATRRTCISQQQTLRMTSYFMLNACVQQETRAAQEIEQRPRR